MAPSLPYPEFNDFHLVLNRKTVHNDEQVEGYAFLSVNNKPNCVRDILIAMRCCFRYRTDDGTTHTVLLHEEIQRNATPFDDIGLPEGDYEFPFSFTIPAQLPPSVVVSGGWDTLNNCKIWYEIRAYVMHTENHTTLERKHLRTSVKFQRCVTHMAPSDELTPQVSKKREYRFNHVDVTMELDKSVYEHGEPIAINITVRNELLRSVSAIKVSCRQHIVIRKRSMRQVKEFIIKHTVAGTEIRGSGVPIKRNQTYSDRITITPKYSMEQAQNSYGGIALSGTLDQDTPSQLSSSIVRHTPEGIEVSYTIQVNLCVLLASDLVVSLPVILSDPMPEETNDPPSYWHEAQKVPEPMPDMPQLQDSTDEKDLPTYDETMMKSSLYRLMQPASGLPDEGNSSESTVPSTGEGDHLPPLDGMMSTDTLGETSRRRPIRMSMNRQSCGSSTDQLNHASLNMNKLRRQSGDRVAVEARGHDSPEEGTDSTAAECPAGTSSTNTPGIGPDTSKHAVSTVDEGSESKGPGYTGGEGGGGDGDGRTTDDGTAISAVSQSKNDNVTVRAVGQSAQ